MDYWDKLSNKERNCMNDELGKWGASGTYGQREGCWEMTFSL